MDIKKTSKIDLVLTEAKVIDEKIIDKNGEIINLPLILSKIYGEEAEFKLTVSRSTSEKIDVDDFEDIDEEE